MLSTSERRDDTAATSAAPPGDADAEDRLDLERAQGGDEAAFTRLFEKHSGRVYALALRMMGRVDMAEDVVQETFVLVHRKASSFRGDARFSTWITSIALNTARMKLRREKRAPLPLEDAAVLPETQGMTASSLAPGHAALADEQQLALDAALATLPRGPRAMVLLAAQGHSYDEMGQLLGISPVQVRGRLYRARQALLEALEGGAR